MKDVCPSLKEIQKAIPGYCFEPSTMKSLRYVLTDFFWIGVLWGLALQISAFLVGWVAWVVWPVYWFCQGTLFWALFVLAHDCGHGSFSKHKWLNQLVGNVLNSLILVPYLPWALSHKHHHQNTGHIDKDEPFAPERSSRKPWKIPKYALRHTLRRYVVGAFGVMWFPYLGFFSKALTSHFWLWDPMFAQKRREVLISLVSFSLAVMVLCGAILQFGFVLVAYCYLIPLFVFASWLVVTTFLHHNEASVPWYGDKEWTYVKGNLSTVDRSYGICDRWVHDIGTHQIHHVFPFIPHYHLKAATAAFQKAFPQYTRVSREPIWKAYFQGVARYAQHGHTSHGVERFVYEEVIQERLLQKSGTAQMP